MVGPLPVCKHARVDPTGDSSVAVLSGQHNLPFDLTRLVGRGREVAAVAHGIDQARLVTLTGPGGCGKTRLATRVAVEVLVGFRHGCWFVDLTATVDGSLVPQLVAQALAVPEPLTAALADRELLIVLDNCEHVVDAAARLVRELLGACPLVRVLATSRRPLGLPGEIVWRVPPLALADAVALFVERARQRRPSFASTPTATRAVEWICERLDGLPLAIELATARVGVLTVEEIAGMLSRRLELLAGGDRGVERRHAGLETALRWSYDLLDEAERRCFERLAVFAGWWARDAVDALASPGATLDLLGALVDQSLVLAETGAEGGTRYRMLEPVRQFGLARLADAGDVPAACTAHAAYAIALARRADPELRGPRQLTWLRRLDDAEPDLRAAAAWLTGSGEAEQAADLGWALWVFWWLRGRFTEGRRAMEQVLGAPLSERGMARAAFVAGAMACGQADYGRAARWLDEAVAGFARLGDDAAEAYALSSAGVAAIGLGEQARGVQLLERGVDLASGAGDRWAASFMCSFLGTAAHGGGEYERAAAYGYRALRLSQVIGDREGASHASRLLAGVTRDTGRHAEAARHFREGLRLAAEVGDAANVVFCLQGLATLELAAARPDAARAVLLISAADALLARTDTGGHLDRPTQDSVAGAAAAARAVLGDAGFGRAWASGQDLSPGDLLAHALDEPQVPPAPGGDPDGLTAREAEVLELIATGRADQQIAAELGVTVSSVEQHVTRLYAKIGARGRADATVHALRRGARAR